LRNAQPCCATDVFVFDDKTDIVLVTLDGAPLTADSGRISNLNLLSDFVNFDVSTTGFSASFLGYTDLLDPSSNTVATALCLRICWEVAPIMSNSDLKGCFQPYPAAHRLFRVCQTPIMRMAISKESGS
jgi:hypothetical protein